MVPPHANFVLVDLGVDDSAVCDAMMRRGFMVRGGTGFGLPGYVRVTVGPIAVMERAAQALIEVVRA